MVPYRPSPVLSLDYTLKVRDRRGRVIALHRAPSESYVRAFIDWLSAMIGGTISTLVPDTGGTNRTFAVSGSMRALAPDNDSTYGPVLGTGTNAVAIGDYKLQTQIVHGVVAGTLDHQATENLGLSTVGTTRLFQFRRLFVNASGGTIPVKECGIYGLNSIYYFCLVRDLVSPDVSIPNGGTGTLIYTIGATV